MAPVLYIVVCSARNRLLVRLRRLREPRYLLGAVFAVVYFYFRAPRPAAWSRRARRGRPRHPLLACPGQVRRVAWWRGHVPAGRLAWILPSKSTLFRFTEAETAFLFPAPVSRRQLLIYRLMRSQLGLLFAAMVPAFLMPAPGTMPISGKTAPGNCAVGDVRDDPGLFCGRDHGAPAFAIG